MMPEKRHPHIKEGMLATDYYYGCIGKSWIVGALSSCVKTLNGNWNWRCTNCGR